MFQSCTFPAMEIAPAPQEKAFRVLEFAWTQKCNLLWYW